MIGNKVYFEMLYIKFDVNKMIDILLMKGQKSPIQKFQEWIQYF